MIVLDLQAVLPAFCGSSRDPDALVVGDCKHAKFVDATWLFLGRFTVDVLLVAFELSWSGEVQRLERIDLRSHRVSDFAPALDIVDPPVGVLAPFDSDGIGDFVDDVASEAAAREECGPAYDGRQNGTAPDGWSVGYSGCCVYRTEGETIARGDRNAC